MALDQGSKREVTEEGTRRGIEEASSVRVERPQYQTLPVYLEAEAAQRSRKLIASIAPVPRRDAAGGDAEHLAQSQNPALLSQKREIYRKQHSGSCVAEQSPVVADVEVELEGQLKSPVRQLKREFLATAEKVDTVLVILDARCCQDSVVAMHGRSAELQL